MEVHMAPRPVINAHTKRVRQEMRGAGAILRLKKKPAHTRNIAYLLGLAPGTVRDRLLRDPILRHMIGHVSARRDTKK